MVKIVATEEQIRQIAETNESVEFVDASGNRLGIFARTADLDDIRISRQRLASDEERLLYSVLLDHLASLEATH